MSSDSPQREKYWRPATIGAALSTGFLAVYAVNVCVDGAFHTELSPAVPSGLTFQVTQGMPFAFLMAGFLIKVLSLAAAIAGIWKLARCIEQGRLYSWAAVRSTKLTSLALFAWLSGVIIEGFGNDFAAERLGIEQWSGSLLTGTSGMTVLWLLLTVMYVLQVSIRRAITLQEDNDGLV